MEHVCGKDVREGKLRKTGVRKGGMQECCRPFLRMSGTGGEGEGGGRSKSRDGEVYRL